MWLFWNHIQFAATQKSHFQVLELIYNAKQLDIWKSHLIWRNWLEKQLQIVREALYQRDTEQNQIIYNSVLSTARLCPVFLFLRVYTRMPNDGQGGQNWNKGANRRRARATPHDHLTSTLHVVWLTGGTFLGVRRGSVGTITTMMTRTTAVWLGQAALLVETEQPKKSRVRLRSTAAFVQRLGGVCFGSQPIVSFLTPLQVPWSSWLHKNKTMVLLSFFNLRLFSEKKIMATTLNMEPNRNSLHKLTEGKNNQWQWRKAQTQVLFLAACVQTLWYN